MTGKRRATFLLNQLFPLGKITLTPDGNRRTEHEPQIQCYGYAPPQWRHAVTVATFRHHRFDTRLEEHWGNTAGRFLAARVMTSCRASKPFSSLSITGSGSAGAYRCLSPCLGPMVSKYRHYSTYRHASPRGAATEQKACRL